MATAAMAPGNTSFVGILTRRQYKPGQRYIQLVFETTNGIKLSLSRNMKLVRSLNIGKTYRIEGTEKVVGSRTYVHEPVAIPMPYELKVSHRRRLKIFSIIAVLIVIGLAGYLLLGDHNTTTLRATPTSHQTAATPVSDSGQSTKQVSATPTTAPISKVVSTTKPQTQIPASATQANAPVVNAPAVVTPAQPDCDVAVSISFGMGTPIVDDTQPAGTIVTPGVDGQRQTCYPDGRSAAGVTTILTQPIDEVTTITSTP